MRDAPWQVIFLRGSNIKYGSSFPFARFSQCTKLSLPLPSKEPWEHKRCCALSQESPAPAAAGQEGVAGVHRDSVEARQQTPGTGAEEVSGATPPSCGRVPQEQSKMEQKQRSQGAQTSFYGFI